MPPSSSSSLSPVLVHDSDSEPPIIISDDDDNEVECIDPVSPRTSPLVVPEDDYEPSQEQLGDMEGSSNNSRNSQPVNVKLREAAAASCDANQRSSNGRSGGGTVASSDTAVSTKDSSPLVLNTVSSGNILTESRTETSPYEVTSTTLTDPMNDSDKGQSSGTLNEDLDKNLVTNIGGQRSKISSNTTGQSSSNFYADSKTHKTGSGLHEALPLQPSTAEPSPPQPAEDGERDEELTLFVDEEQFPSTGLDMTYTGSEYYKGSSKTKRKETKILPSDHQDRHSRKKLSRDRSWSDSYNKSSKRESRDDTYTQKQRTQDHEDGYSSRTKSSSKQRDQSWSRQRKHSRHGRDRSRSRSRGKSPRRKSSYEKYHHYPYHSDSSEGEWFSRTSREKSKSSLLKSRTNDDGDSEYRSSQRRHKERNRESHTSYRGDHDYDRQSGRGSPHYKREEQHHTRLYSDDFTVDRTQRHSSDHKKLKRKDHSQEEDKEGGYHQKRSKNVRSRARSWSESSDERFSKSKARSSRKKSVITRITSDVEEDSDENRRKLSQELSELDAQIKENKKELLKSMLRRERTELIQKQLHTSSLSSLDCDDFLEEHKPVDCRVATALEMIEELVYLDQAIVEGKKQLLKVVKRMEEDKAERDSD